MKILYRIEKSIHSKQIYQSESPFNYKKKENINFIKNIRKYFIEDKDNYHNHHHKFKNNNQKSRKKIDNNYNLLTKKSEYKENHMISTKNYPIYSNFLSSNTIEIIKEKHFVNNDNNNDFNEKNRSNSLSNVRRLNAIDNKSYYFNPIRKTENLNEQALLSASSLALPSIRYVLIGKSDDVCGPLLIQPKDSRDFPDFWRFRETHFPTLCKFTDFL